MISKYFPKKQHLFQAIGLVAIVCIFSYCSSSTEKTASSFSKRKYTKGHFSDPVAKVNTEYKSYASNTTLPSAAPKIQPEISTNGLSKNTSTAVNPNFKTSGQPVASGNTKSVNGGPNNSTSIANNSNANLKTGNVSEPEHPYGYQHDHDYDHHGSNANSLLIAWIVCLAISVICLLLIYSSVVYGSGAAAGELGAGCALYILSSFAFIAAIVLFILWIIAISRG